MRHVAVVVQRMVGACRTAIRRMMFFAYGPIACVAGRRIHQRSCVPSFRKPGHLDMSPAAPQNSRRLSARRRCGKQRWLGGPAPSQVM
jgi:hypothetical protein